MRASAKDNGATVNPTADTVQMAFISGGAEPAGGDWKTAVAETDGTTNPDTHLARCLVGPGGTATLADGTYDVWVKIADSPETPVKKSGVLIVT